MAEDRLRVALIVDAPEYLAFFSRLGRILEGTGQVEGALLIGHARTPDGDGSVPFYRIRKRIRDRPQHAYDWTDLTAYERWLVGVDDYFLGRYTDAAAGLCADAERWFDQHPTDCAVVWSGTRLIARSMAAAARACGVPVVTLETPYFPVTPDTPPDDPGLTLHRMTMRALIWDMVQAPQCGPSQITAEWEGYPVAEGLPQFIAALHAGRQSKFSATDISRFLSGGERAGPPPEPAADFSRPPGARVLLACGQLNKDSAAFFGRHLVSRWQEMVTEVAARLPPGWVMWFKAHPLDTDYLAEAERFEADVHARFPACRCLPPAMNIHDALQAADAVVCINSNVGLEATTYDKPVITLGEGYYTDKGFTHPAPSLDALGELIAGLPPTMTDQQKAIRDRFLSYLLYHYLIPVGRPERALERMRQAVAAAPSGGGRGEGGCSRAVAAAAAAGGIAGGAGAPPEGADRGLPALRL